MDNVFPSDLVKSVDLFFLCVLSDFCEKIFSNDFINYNDVVLCGRILLYTSPNHCCFSC